VFWAPAAAPAVVALLAPVPDIGIVSVARADLVPTGRARADGLDWYRVDGHTFVIAGDSKGEPVGFLLPVDDVWSTRLAAAERARSLLLGRSPPRTLTKQQGERIRGALRAIDGQEQGANYRSLATAFFGQERIDQEPWKTSSLKARVVRLVAHGRMLIADGYRRLLRGGFGRS
jgi:Uncharacterized conserved protein (DUF2285)